MNTFTFSTHASQELAAGLSLGGVFREEGESTMKLDKEQTTDMPTPALKLDKEQTTDTPTPALKLYCGDDADGAESATNLDPDPSPHNLNAEVENFWAGRNTATRHSARVAA